MSWLNEISAEMQVQAYKKHIEHLIKQYEEKAKNATEAMLDTSHNENVRMLAEVRRNDFVAIVADLKMLLL